MRFSLFLLFKNSSTIYTSPLFSFRHLLRFSSNYKSTLLLPKSDFPHKINSSNRLDRDLFIEKETNFESLYKWQQEHNVGNVFILHDGPPYANGDVHIGHAVNKILKDITLRHRLIKGNKINFIPGWDCHGLPIELKVLKEAKEPLTPLKLRQKAFQFSQKAKQTQLTSFKKWGLLSNWDNCYTTCHPTYVSKLLSLFQQLYEKGVIFQDNKPVYWSPWNQTSLAEAELEYNNKHVSKSIYVKLTITRCPSFIKSRLKDPSIKLSLLIWTTTPWTLPANQAVCYSPTKRYCVVFSKEFGEYFVIAKETIPSLESILQVKFDTFEDFEGSILQDITYQHPVYSNRECPLLSAHHVTMTKGTGLVHMAPNHGFDDFTVAQNHKLPLDPCLVDENGNYIKEAEENIAGLDVLTSGTNRVLELLKDKVIHLEDYTHSYPYDWRSNKPVIIRCSRQWFIDVSSIKETARQCLQNVDMVPKHFKQAFLNQLDASPQWCISRQRSWGVPIPAFYSDNEPFVHREITEHLCKLVMTKGIHVWWELSSEELFPVSLKKKCQMPEKVFTKGKDIMDIWLDSGISWMSVLPDPQVSDVCIEGIDQIRGWFNSSLLTSVATRTKAPYKKLFLHGFTTDADGFKMSKSKGNVISPTNITDGSKKMKLPALGIDTLRWWVASHACQHENISVKTDIIEEGSYNLNKFRNVFKFLLGNLTEFDFENLISPSNMRALDLYMLHDLMRFSTKIKSEFDAMQYKTVSKDLVNFVTNDVSAFYCQLTKDRLYCHERYSEGRVSCQTVLYFILNELIQAIAPITPHLAEEVFLYHPRKDFAINGVFRCRFQSLQEFLTDTKLPESVVLGCELRENILKTEIKTLNMNLIVVGKPELLNHLKCLNSNASDLGHDGLSEFFQAAKVSLCTELPENKSSDSLTISDSIELEDKRVPYTVIFEKTAMQRCSRCRLYCAQDSSVLCDRCLEVNLKLQSEEQDCRTNNVQA